MSAEKCVGLLIARVGRFEHCIRKLRPLTTPMMAPLHTISIVRRTNANRLDVLVWWSTPMPNYPFAHSIRAPKLNSTRSRWSSCHHRHVYYSIGRCLHWSILRWSNANILSFHGRRVPAHVSKQWIRYPHSALQPHFLRLIRTPERNGRLRIHQLLCLRNDCSWKSFGWTNKSIDLVACRLTPCTKVNDSTNRIFRFGPRINSRRTTQNYWTLRIMQGTNSILWFSVLCLKASFYLIYFIIN